MILEAHDLTYAYTLGRPVLHDVSLRLEAGQILYLMGRNGSGKTTLLACLAGIQKPLRGRVQLDGTDLFQYPPAERAQRIGLIPQIHIPAFPYSVREMVLMGRAPYLGLFGTPGRTDQHITDEALENVGLAALADRPYTELSGGERQLVLIARGLAQQSPILLMDEPDAHLDPNNQHRVLEIVAQLAGRGLSFVISSHAPNNALIYADHVLLMKQGRIMARGTPAETLTEPLLSEAYSMGTEVIYQTNNGTRVPRAILPRRPLALPPEALGVPGSPLARVYAQSKHGPQLVIVTGLGGTGKTTWCSGLVDEARQQGLAVAGLLCPAVFEDGKKTGIDMINLANGERRRLANLRDERSRGLMTTQWHFDSDAMAWGNRLLGSLPPADLLVIDELGPLEFLRGEGLQEGMRLVDERRYKMACIVVRSALLPDAQQRWPGALIISPAGST